MDTYDAIMKRRSVRRYTDKAVDDQTVEKIMQAAMYAPSAVNFQPWYYVVIKSREKMAEFVKIMDEVADKNIPGLKDRFKSHPEIVAESDYFIRYLGKAPVCILAFEHKKEYSKSESSIVQSVAVSIENILLAATEFGLGSCYLTAPLEAGLDGRIQEKYAPDKGKLVALVTIGYAETIPQAPRRKEGRYVII